MLLSSRRRIHEKDTPKTRIAHTKYVVCIPHTLCYSKYNHKHALLYYFTTQSKYIIICLYHFTAPMTGQYVQMKIKQFERRFNGLKRAARTSLERINVSVKQVADVLMDLPADDMEEHKQFLESHLSILYQAHDQSELFGALGFNMNYLSYQLLEYLIFEFELEVAEEMEVYKADLRRFRERTSLLLFCQTQKKRYVEPPSRFQEVVGKFKWPRDVTLEVVEQFRQEYAFHYNLRECAMMLVEVRPGSFVVAWFVPESIVEKLKMKIPEKILEKFATAELTIGGDCIYSSEDAEVWIVAPHQLCFIIILLL